MKWIRNIFIIIISLLLIENSHAQHINIERVEPLNWWVGMESPELQLLIKGKDISNTKVKIDYPGVEVRQIHKADNPDFLFVDIVIHDNARAGEMTIKFLPERGKAIDYKYSLKERENDRWVFNGLDQSDVIYLITPDRYVNGDPENDEVIELKEGIDMGFHSGRHGGDLQGIISKLDYIEDLGVTSLWLNPVLENDMPEYSYHGYATTDYYKVDARYGTNELYKALADSLHSRKMKLIMDMVFNHCGLEHWWMKEMPFDDWIHYYPEYVNTNHAISAISDPHAADSDLNQMEKGWFVSAMPDLNHDNPFMANYLIQNSIWWIEYVGLDGIRMDTYPYNDKDFMKRWTEKVFEEYPDFYIVGETWVDNEAQESFWAEKNPLNNTTFHSGLNSVTDFPLCNAIHSAFQEDGDIKDVYNVVSKDFLYYQPSMNKIFADNHDMDRFYHTIGENLEKFKLAMSMLLTMRGIPQVYYGSEIIMRGHGEHGVIREDFPGGWPSDGRDAFTGAGRTEDENEAFEHMKHLLNWRKNSDAIANGKLKHFVPYENVYVYNRKSDKESVLVIVNNNSSGKILDMKRYAEVLEGFDGAEDVITDKEFNDLSEIQMGANEALILKLNPELKTDLNLK